METISEVQNAKLSNKARAAWRSWNPCEFLKAQTAANIKKPRKAEVYYVPLPPKGESTESLETERVALFSEIKKQDNEAVIKAKIERTFSHRRLEIVEQRPMIKDFINRWPALFKESDVSKMIVYQQI